MEQMTLRRAVLVWVCVAAEACSSASRPAVQVAQLPAEKIVTARRAGMSMSGAVLGSLKAAAANGAEVRTQAYSAGGLARWARALPAMFPPGTGPDGTGLLTHARREVWTQRTAFDREADGFIAATQALAESASSNDAARFRDQVAVVQRACDSCHGTYQAKS
jgi:cytochrome c556